MGIGRTLEIVAAVVALSIGLAADEPAKPCKITAGFPTVASF